MRSPLRKSVCVKWGFIRHKTTGFVVFLLFWFVLIERKKYSLKFIFVLYVCMFCLHTCLCTTCTLCVCRGRVWELSCGCQKMDSRLLEEHQVRLSVEPSLQFQTPAPCFCSEYQGLNCQASTLLLSQIPAPCWILILLGYDTLLLCPHSYFLKSLFCAIV